MNNIEQTDPFNIQLGGLTPFESRFILRLLYLRNFLLSPRDPVH